MGGPDAALVLGLDLGARFLAHGNHAQGHGRQRGGGFQGSVKGDALPDGVDGDIQSGAHVAIGNYRACRGRCRHQWNAGLEQGRQRAGEASGFVLADEGAEGHGGEPRRPVRRRRRGGTMTA